MVNVVANQHLPIMEGTHMYFCAGYSLWEMMLLIRPYEGRNYSLIKANLSRSISRRWSVSWPLW